LHDPRIGVPRERRRDELHDAIEMLRRDCETLGLMAAYRRPAGGYWVWPEGGREYGKEHDHD
jgi:hypothetical protein